MFKPELELHMINIIYANKQNAKTTSAKLYIYIGVGSRDLCIDKAHTALDIFCFAIFLIDEQYKVVCCNLSVYLSLSWSESF